MISPPLPAGRWPGLVILLLACLAETGCERRADGRLHFRGEPRVENRWKPASATVDFSTLVRQNCVACHGFGGNPGAVIALDNPVFARVIPPADLRRIITEGRPGTRMPAFGKRFGGNLTPDQIEILVAGIAPKESPPAAGFPAYVGPPGNAEAGRPAFTMRCAGCHGRNGTGGPLAGSVVDRAYLDLVSDQYLRTITIAGRPDFRMPPPTAGGITDQEVSDIVAWLVSHRNRGPGEPSAAPTP